MSDEATYKIVRHFQNSGRRFLIKSGLTLALAKEHCNNPETSSSTCTGEAGKRRTRLSGPWFDAFTREN